MNLQQLDYFEAVYAKRSYAAAAKEIPMSHQGLLKSMSALQAELGVPLFRASEGSTVVAPTEYADAFHDFTVAVRACRDKLEEDFGRITRAGNTIRLGSSTGVLGMLGIGFLEAFREANPGITVIEEELADLRCDDGLSAGFFDLALTVFPYDESYETIPLYLMDRYVWVSRNDSLGRKESLNVNDLEGRHVGVMGPTFKNYGGLLDLARERGVTFASVDAAAEILWLSRYAHSSGHVAFTARHIVPLFEQDELIVARRFEGLPWGFGVSWPKGHELSEQENALVRYCVDYAHRMAARGVEGYLEE